MQKRKLRIIKPSLPPIGICEHCNLRFRSSKISEHEADAEICRFTFAHLALCAAAIRLRPAAVIMRFGFGACPQSVVFADLHAGQDRLGWQKGQFRAPRHVIRLMVEMVEPKPTDIVCDPACETCGFLVAVGESLSERHPEVLTNSKLRQHFHHGLFHGFDFDNTMLRTGSMNMLLHGVENPDVIYRDSLSQDHGGEEEQP